jgi:adenylate kinase
MIVVVTGMVGVDKKSYLQQVCRFAAGKGKKVLLCNVGDMMYAEAPDIPKGKILDIPMKRLNSLRRSVFKDIIAKAQEAPNLIVNTHATFRWRHGLFPAVDFDQMRQLGADIYICLIDGVAALHSRLSEHASEHTLKDLIVWREEEIISTEMHQREYAVLLSRPRLNDRNRRDVLPAPLRAAIQTHLYQLSDDGGGRTRRRQKRNQRFSRGYETALCLF